MPRPLRKPSWLRVRVPGGKTHQELKRTLRKGHLHTVCEEALCPNMGECWRAGTATVMVLGKTCSRGCRFCGVTSGKLDGAVDSREPDEVAVAVAAMALKYVVLTMVNRDDLPDGGAAHVAATIGRLRARCPEILVEALVGDFAGRAESVDTICEAAPDVFAHNLEVVRSVTPALRDGRCSYDRSLTVLRWAKERSPERLTKSSLMVGVGEEDDEVVASMADLRAVGVDVLTIGQYLQPSRKHAPVCRYVHPDRFAEWSRMGEELGFCCVAAGPLVRSSYRAAEVFVESQLRGTPPGEPAGGAGAVTGRRLSS
ncbi:MAG: lipoyl synthase [Deltaproteobacteria bacterium]|nr:lipoyl synthase [Deltaproteobacteria bacterium]